MDAPSPLPPARPAVGRAFLGLALLGWGLSILLGITPHEDLFVGTGLAVFGAAMLATAPRLPEIPSLPAWTVAGLGVALVGGLAGFTAATHGAWDLQKGVLLGLGVALMAASLALGRRLRVGRKGRTVSVGSAVVAVLAVLGAPLAVWSLQAAAKGVFGTTPGEAFVRYALVLPSGLLLSGLGMHPVVAGQTISFPTPRGILSVEVGAACSGIQAMALFMAVLGAYLWSEKPGGRRLAVWSAIGLGGVYLANLLRLFVLFLVGYHWGSAALLQVHAQAGWMFFAAWALAFAWLARRARAIA
jgi:exosortase/archaeosortase family protein